MSQTRKRPEHRQRRASAHFGTSHAKDAARSKEARVPTPVQAAGESCQGHVDADKIAVFGIMP